jgi:hypothetical protein
VLNSLATVIGQTPQELKAFIYNMHYDPIVMFIYEIWERYLNRPAERTLRVDSGTAPALQVADGNGAKDVQHQPLPAK